MRCSTWDNACPGRYRFQCGSPPSPRSLAPTLQLLLPFSFFFFSFCNKDLSLVFRVNSLMGGRGLENLVCPWRGPLRTISFVALSLKSIEHPCFLLCFFLTLWVLFSQQRPTRPGCPLRRDSVREPAGKGGGSGLKTQKFPVLQPQGK